MALNELFSKKAIMAPMSDVNLPAFCGILKDLGCTMIYTGLLTSHGLVYQNRHTLEMISALPEGVTFVGQIFGSVPEIMAEAASILESTGKFAAVDINMGCPVPKVVKSNAGVGLMREPELAARIVKSVNAAVKLPVTVKMRSGWSAEEINCIEVAKRCEDAGAAAVALHPRTKAQAYSGRADWPLVARMKESLEIPVIGSGDISSPQDAIQKISDCGCDSVMIGRATRCDPTLPGRTQLLLDSGKLSPPPSWRDRIKIAIRHFKFHIELEGPDRGSRSLRSHLAYYIKGMSGAAAVRNKIVQIADPLMIIDILNNYRDWLEREEKRADTENKGGRSGVKEKDCKNDETILPTSLFE